MLCTRGLDTQAADGRSLARRQLGHRGEPGAAKELPAARGAEHRHLRVEAPKGAAVRVVEVQVREQHGVDPVGDLGWWIAALPAQRADPAAQHGIGEQPLALQLEEDRGVANVRDPIAHPAPWPCRLAL